MHIDLTGKTAIVNGRSAEGVDKAVITLQNGLTDADVAGFADDLGTAEGCRELYETYSTCDFLVNNIGMYGTENFFETPDSVWSEDFAVNVMSGVRLSSANVPAMDV